MKIRALTVGLEINTASLNEDVRKAARLLLALKQDLAALGFEVQTTRLTTQPIARIHGISNAKDLVTLATELSTICLRSSIEWCCIGPLMPHSPDSRWLVDGIVDVIASTENVFTSIMTTSADCIIDMTQIGLASQTIKLVSESKPEGWGNFRFAAISCCPPHIPFLPAGYHMGKRNGLSIGLEYVEDVLKIVSESKSVLNIAKESGETLERLKRQIASRISEMILPMQDLVTARCQEHEFDFWGFDTSLAPFPTQERSTGALVEALGVEHFGAPGTMFATAFLTDCTRHISVKRCGFCGVFYPVLEDYVISKRNDQGLVSMNSLLLFSAVCGIGLDLVPLPGDISREQLEHILWMVAKISQDYKKPLVACLLPVPGRLSGDTTNLQFPFVINTKVMSI